jgi:serine protease Do
VQGGNEGTTASLGSAVAISRNEAITNCHIVARTNQVTLHNGSTTLPARVTSADEATDRCYLAVLGDTLEPIIGLRDYSDLVVGETVYTIGSPSGLDKTLGQGLISGLRTIKDLQFIQITAPVSRDSSGGGLFDDRGNLIGITTFTIRDAQSLNFAIAASEYWR